MQLAPAIPLLLTDHGCPLAFNVVDASAPRPQPIIGRAIYKCWDQAAGVIWYRATIHLDGRTYHVAQFAVQAKRKL